MSTISPREKRGWATVGPIAMLIPAFILRLAYHYRYNRGNIYIQLGTVAVPVQPYQSPEALEGFPLRGLLAHFKTFTGR